MGQVHPLTPKMDGATTNLPPTPLLIKFLGIIFSLKIDILLFKVLKNCYHSVYHV